MLTINGGSSSLKYALFAAGDPPSELLSGEIQRVGSGQATLQTKSVDGRQWDARAIDAPDHEQVAMRLVDSLEQQAGLRSVVAIGHRIVHGGTRYAETQRITPEVVNELKRLSPIDPDHLPQEIVLIEALARRFPGVPQVACFDTAFHRHLPRVAQLLPVPRRYEAEGIRRYGFHGLSYSFLLDELTRTAGPDVARGRIILAHLGAGASLAAVREGISLDTTMAFTPTAGLVMATRSGDLDPGVLIYLMRSQRMTVDQIDDLVNRRSGLLGLSETSSDMRDLLARQASDPRAADAVELFCYQARKWIGAMAAALDGLDTLVFAGGIGENAPEVRKRICEGLGFLDVHLDENRNSASAAIISAVGSRTTVRVMHTDEQLMIAKEVRRVLGDLLRNA